MKFFGINRSSGMVGLMVILAFSALCWFWSREPDAFPITAGDAQSPPGYTTTTALIAVSQRMLDKPGGYLSNDIFPPGLLLDNMPAWEFGVLTQVRDLSQSLRNDMSRSQSQSIDDKDLSKAAPQFNFDNGSWVFPSSENEYRNGIAALERYLQRLADPNDRSAHFYARADNLREWLALVEKRLGSLAQRLSSSVGQLQVAGSTATGQADSQEQAVVITTPWLQVDNIFYEARGASWALSHFFHAIGVDFREVLEKKNALISLRQVIRELEAAQAAVWSPVILNGGRFSLLANHSLEMSSYIARANATVIDLRSLLEQG